MLITISRSLETDIMNFVRINEISDINSFLANCLRDGFNIAKYGNSPQDNFNKENKLLKVEKYDTEEECDVERFESKENKKNSKKQCSDDKKNVKSIEEKEEQIKGKKTIKIIRR